MNDNLLSNGELKDSYFARPITKNDDYIPYEVVEKYNKELARYKKYKQALEEIREITNECITDCMGTKCEGMEEIQNKIDEALNDRN